jgi:hypothetical protein
MDETEYIAKYIEYFTPHHVLHPYLGFSLDPTSAPPFPLDEFGFLNEASPLSPPVPGNLRVAVTGGSVAMFLVVTYGDILRKEIASRFARPAQSIELVSLAHGGFKQPQQLMLLNLMLALGSKFDFVVNLDGFNEVALHPCENGLKGVDLTYPRQWYFVVEPFKSAEERLFAARIQEQKERTKALEEKLEKGKFSVLKPFIEMLKNAAVKKTMHLEDQFRTATFPDLSYQTKGRGRTYQNDEEMFSQLARIWRTSSALMNSVCRGNGITYHHFLQPNQYFEGTKTFTLEERTLLYQPDHPYRFGAEKGHAYLVQACAELAASGVPATNLSMVFRDVAETTYVDSCCHLNELGNRIVSAAIASALAQKSG